MEYKLQDQLCVTIYNYLEKNLNAENATAFVMLKQEMEKQSIEKQKKEAEDKLRAEIKAEAKKDDPTD